MSVSCRFLVFLFLIFILLLILIFILLLVLLTLLLLGSCGGADRTHSSLTTISGVRDLNTITALRFYTVNLVGSSYRYRFRITPFSVQEACQFHDVFFRNELNVYIQAVLFTQSGIFTGICHLCSCAFTCLHTALLSVPPIPSATPFP